MSNAVDSLVKTLQEKMNERDADDTDFVYGQVTSTNPLKIKVDNRFEVTSQFLILSKFVREFHITVRTEVDGGFTHGHGATHDIKADSKADTDVKVTDPEDEVEVDVKVDVDTSISGGVSIESHTQPGHTHVVNIPVWRGLQVGDRVRMLRVSGGQLYYVLEREE